MDARQAPRIGLTHSRPVPTLAAVIKTTNNNLLLTIALLLPRTVVGC